MKEVQITASSWVPLGAVATTVVFIVAAAMWASQIENKADNALMFQAKHEGAIEKRLKRIEEKLDRALSQ